MVSAKISSSRPITKRVDGAGRSREYSLAAQSDGKVLIGGNSGIARLNADGTLDTRFEPGFSGGTVNSVALQSDGKVLIGGSLPPVNGVPVAGFARLWG